MARLTTARHELHAHPVTEPMKIDSRAGRVNRCSLLLLRGTVMSQLILLVALLLLSSYWQFSATEVLSFPVDDGWCGADQAGVGSHCFGDFGYELVNAGLADPWHDEMNPYPPSSMVLFDGFRLLKGALGYNTALGFYLLTLLSSAALSIWLMCRRSTLGAHDPFAASIVVVLGWGFLSALDRGNNVIWLMPLVVVLLTPMRGGIRRSWWVVLCMALLKPQFLLVGATFGLVSLVRMVIAFGGVQVLATAWLVGPAQLVGGLQSWISAVSSNGNYPIDRGQNSSLTSALQVVSQALLDWPIVDVLAEMRPRIPIGLVFALSYAAIALVAAQRRPSRVVPTSRWLGLGLVVSVMTPSTVFPYYVIVFQLVALMWMGSATGSVDGFSGVRREASFSHFSVGLLFVVSSVTAFDPSSNRHLSVVLLPIVALVFIPFALMNLAATTLGGSSDRPE